MRFTNAYSASSVCSPTRFGSATCSGACAASALCGAEHLYDLEADLREQADLARTRPDDLAGLRGAWEAINAQLLP